MISTKKQIGACVFFIGLSILYLIGTAFIKTVNVFGVTVVSSSTIPRVLGVMLLVLSSMLLVKTLSAGKKQAAQNQTIPARAASSGAVTENGQLDIAKSLEEAENNEGTGDVDVLSILLTLASLILFAALMAPLGFLCSSFLYLVLQTTILTKKALRKKKFPFIVVFSLVSSLAIYFLFTKGLSLMLPAGILG